MAKMASLYEETTRQTQAIQITEDQWYARYAPMTDSPLDDVDDYVPVRNVWTLVETDGSLYVLNGFHVVNKIGYHITEERWARGEEIEVRIDD